MFFSSLLDFYWFFVVFFFMVKMMSGEKEMDIYGVGVKDKCHFVKVDADDIIDVCSAAKGNSPLKLNCKR
jgi:hypothetical protein